MFRRIEDLRTCLAEETEKTLQILDALPEAALDTRVAEGFRDLRRMAWHLVETRLEMPGHLGLRVKGCHLLQGPFIQDPPATLGEIRATFAEAAASLDEALATWTDADLDREDELYGETWRRGRTFMVLVVHEIHHRGQMTVLMRQAGLPVPGIYGPAKEGWAAYNVEAPRV
ncbi:MAG TPA: DinB family protein [Holophaga sp.]|nr:DinB family protein [Holophaga sp.]